MRSRGEILEVLLDVGATLRELTNRSEITGTATDAYILGIYANCASLYRGCVALIEASLPDESLILGRRLFEQSLWLSELHRAAGRQARDSLMLKWRLDAINREEGLIQDAVGIGHETDPEPALAALAEERRKVERYQKRHGVGQLRGFEDTRSASRRENRVESWLTYRLSHQLVHGNPIAVLLRTTSSKAGTIEIRTESGALESLAAAGIWAAESMLASFRATAGIFGWEVPEAVERIEQRIGRLDGEVASSR